MWRPKRRCRPLEHKRWKHIIRERYFGCEVAHLSLCQDKLCTASTNLNGERESQIKGICSSLFRGHSWLNFNWSFQLRILCLVLLSGIISQTWARTRTRTIWPWFSRIKPWFWLWTSSAQIWKWEGGILLFKFKTTIAGIFCEKCGLFAWRLVTWILLLRFLSQFPRGCTWHKLAIRPNKIHKIVVNFLCVKKGSTTPSQFHRQEQCISIYRLHSLPHVNNFWGPWCKFGSIHSLQYVDFANLCITSQHSWRRLDLQIKLKVAWFAVVFCWIFS